MIDFTLKAGKDADFGLVYKDKDGAPINVTGFTARLVFRRTMYSDVIGTIVGVVGNVDGKINFPFTPSDTNNLLTDKTSEEYKYSAEITENTGKVKDLVEGTITLVQSVAR